jgi:hypothetical protein
VGVVAKGGGFCLKDGGFVILGVTSPAHPSEGRLCPPDPLQKSVRVCGLLDFFGGGLFEKEILALLGVALQI